MTNSPFERSSPAGGLPPVKRLLALAFVLWSSTSFAFPFKCDKDQAQCEVQTRRLTVGDKVGVFTPEKELVALGEVTDIDGGKRIIKITKKWAILLRSHDIDIINDLAYSAPEAHYKIITPLARTAWAGQIALVNIGIGDGFIGTEVSGLFFKHFWRDFSYFGRLHYLTGKGSASDNLGGIQSLDVNINSMGASGGVSEMILPFAAIAIRLDAEVGFGVGTVTLSGDYDKDKILNSRFKDGMGIYARGGAAAVWRRDGIQPEVGLAILHLHNSNNTAFFLGLNGTIK